MLTWALADKLTDEPITANAVNPGYVLTPLTQQGHWAAEAPHRAHRLCGTDPLDGADTTIWAAASPELDGTTGKFWGKRREIRCRFRHPAEIDKLRTMVEQQLTDASSPAASGASVEAPT